MADPVRLVRDDVLSSSRSSSARGSRVTARPIVREEHAANVARLRAVLSFALALWVATLALDVAVVTYVAPGSIRWFLAMRAPVVVLVLSSIVYLRRSPDPSPRALRVIDVVAFTPTVVCIALMTLRYKGIASPYALGVMCVLIVRGVALPDHWRRNLVGLGIPTVGYLVAQCALGLVVRSTAAQFHDPAAVTELAIAAVLHLAAGILLLVSGHTQWSLRRQVIEAQQVGRYRLKRKLGAGSMGEVWLAWHPALRSDVAIKLLAGSSGEGVARFEREIRATADLRHPNTVRVFDCGVTDEGQWFFAMEHLEGETLSALVRREGPLAPARALRLVLQAARALAEAHGRAIIHRDVKPDNLFVTTIAGEADFIKVLDFGVARVSTGADGDIDVASLTHDGAIIGTPKYMAPEQGMGETSDARSDVYSLGCVLYFTLTGHAPFEEGNATSIMLAHVTRAPEPVALRAPNALSPRLVGVVERCLAKSPGERFADAREVADALASCARHMEHDTAPPDSIVPPAGVAV